MQALVETTLLLSSVTAVQLWTSWVASYVKATCETDSPPGMTSDSEPENARKVLSAWQRLMSLVSVSDPQVPLSASENDSGVPRTVPLMLAEICTPTVSEKVTKPTPST